MIKTGFETRVKVHQIIENQLPEFILDESPKAAEFLKQYYLSQEYQGGVSDISENLDQYLKLDNLTPEVVVDHSTLSNSIGEDDAVIVVSSTKGFPQKYGLIKIDDEVITYTDSTSTSFIGCVRGFSGITTYHSVDNPGELVFESTTSTSHESGTTIQNLSSLFLREFYKKLKFSLAPGLEDLNFVDGLNVGNFIKEAKTLYKSKGTEESFKILFNILYGVTPKIINLENYLIKPSSSEYLRREIVVAEVISGDPTKLVGQTIKQSDNDKIFASVSGVDSLTRKNITYYQLSLFVGSDEDSISKTSFTVPGRSLVSDKVGEGSSIITVDSTVGFPNSGDLIIGNLNIKYTSKSVNQFYGCSGITEPIDVKTPVRSNLFAYGYENGDLTKKVELRLTGIISSFVSDSSNVGIEEGDFVYVKNLGEIVENPDQNKTYKQKIINSWIYNTSSRYAISSIDGSTFVLGSKVDKSSLKVGDRVEILIKDSDTVASSLTDVPFIQSISRQNNQVIVGNLTGFEYNPNLRYDLRRKLNKASSTNVPIEFGNGLVLSDIQNVYNDSDEYIYVASNSLPSYTITKDIFEISISEASEPALQSYDILTEKYSVISFPSNVPFITGDEIYYYPESNAIPGLEEGVYYVEVLSEPNQVRLYNSRSFIGSINYLKFESLPSGSGSHNFVLNAQKNGIISPQKILRKFPLSTNISDGISDDTAPGFTGMLVNGVEISNYKSNERIYYGPVDSVKVINGGSEYDVVNPPQIEVSDPSGSGAKIQPVIRGFVEKVIVDPQIISLDSIVSIALTGGNGSGASFYPVLNTKKYRDIEFSAKLSDDNGGVDIGYDTITFLDKHFLNNGDLITYDKNGNDAIGVGTFDGSNSDTGLRLTDKSQYYCEVVNDTTIRLYENSKDLEVGINTVGFTNYGNAGIHKFRTADPRVVLKDIVVLDSGQNYENRKLIVKPVNISTTYNTVNFDNHGFNDGDLIRYEYETSSISGLSTTTNYKVLKLDDNSFRICEDKTESGHTLSNYERKKYLEFGSAGTGYQYFKYPDINFSINYSTVGVGTTAKVVGVLTATPVIRGEVVDAYLYEGGSNYGSKTLNLHRKPKITVKNGKNAEIKPIVINGSLSKAIVQYGGSEYYSTPDLVVVGDGDGASLRPIIENGKIKEVIVINSGIGYTQETTSISVRPSGKNLILDTDIRYLSLNKNKKYGNEILDIGSNGIQYSVTAYDSKIQSHFKDTDVTKHSPIIGWAYDGNPIYGPYGYSDSKDIDSPTKLLSTGYELDESNLYNRPSDFEPGFFADDYRYTGSGDLDEHNGRFCKTPEFPNGVYAYFATLNSQNVGISSFPYFIGNSYRSKYDKDNITLNQSFDFNNSSLIRNTFPYKLRDSQANNDFIFESYDYYDQRSEIESIFGSSIENIEIIGVGTDYKVGDKLLFDNSNTNGSGLKVIVSEVGGKNITNLNTSIEKYSNSVVSWKNESTLEFKIEPYHNLIDGDYVSVTGIATSPLKNITSLNKIGIVSFTTILSKDIPSNSTTGLATDVYVNNIPSDVSIGSSVKIGSEITSLLNIFPEQKIIRVRRDVGSSHSTSTEVYFIPDKFTISSNNSYFESEANKKVFFKPSESVGFGLSVGVTSTTTFALGVTTTGVSTYARTIQSQSLYVKDHGFKDNQKVILRKPSSSYSSLSVSTSYSGSPFNLPESGTSQVVYITNKTKNTIGIKTSINSSEVFFVSDGGSADSYEYSLETDYSKITSGIEKIKTVVSVSTSHSLRNGDKIRLTVNPEKTVGIQTFNSVYVKFDEGSQNLIINPIGFSSSVVDTTYDQINLSSHQLKTGDKVYYSSEDLVSSGLTTGSYYVYKVDSNSIKLCETYIDSISNPPKTVSIASTGGLNQELGLVNPELSTIRNNSLKFDLSDTSLYGYDFKLYYDEDFQDEFLSVESSSDFVVSGVGTVGLSTNASLTLNYLDQIPQKLFYSLITPAGYISTSDKTVTNSSQINFDNSFYNGDYFVSDIQDNSFAISLKSSPEVLSYSSEECKTLEYSTDSKYALGGISKVKILSSGSNYTKVPPFAGSISSEGTGAYVVAESEEIGKINQIRIVNPGFEYSSDNTLRPSAYISPSISLKSSYKISSVGISSNGINYNSSPDLIVVDSITREVFDSGLLVSKLSGGSISEVSIEEYPYGISSNESNIIAINNDNGYTVKTIETSNTGVATCYLETPVLGFTKHPFSVGDKIFVEGIVNSDSGTGYNSKDNGYNFFTVTNFTNTIPATVEFNVSNHSSNPGIAKTVQDSLATIVNYNDYPKFTVVKEFGEFILGEKLLVYVSGQYIQSDLEILKSTNDSIKIYGDYQLQKGQKIKGIKSGVIATIDSIVNNYGSFDTGSSTRKDFGWKNDIGKLNDDKQNLADNDYYQNLSYSVNSSIDYETLSVPVNRLVHTAGMKNFADTQIQSVVESGIKTSKNVSFEVLDIIDENRVDQVKNFDFVYDFNTLENKSKFVKFKTKKLSSYVECLSNRVLSIDDISSRFSNVGLEESDQNIIDSDTEEYGGFSRYLIQIKDTDNLEYQLNEVIVIGDGSDIFILEKLLLTNKEEKVASIDGGVDLDGNNYIAFNANDPYTKDYDIKIISNKFSTDLVGIGSTTLGLVNLTSSIKTVNSGISTSIVSFGSSEYSSLYFNAYVKDTISGESNYVEIYLNHDGSDVYLSDYYFDSAKSSRNLPFNDIGEFDASLNDGIISLDFTNDTSNKLRIGVKSIGFGLTSSGISTFRFKSEEQTDGTEKTALYQSNYSVSSGISTILSASKYDFTSIKSVVNLSIGSTSALYQIAVLNDGLDSYMSVYQPLSIGSTSGIGTFGSTIDSNNVSLVFYPDQTITGDVTITSYNELIYTDYDLINVPNDLEYGSSRDSYSFIEYGGINGVRVERKDFDLYHKNSPIFKKTFNPTNTSILNPTTGVFTLKNHFFNTGEELVYTPESSLSNVSPVSLSIGSTLNSVGVVTDILPSDVYPIKLTEDTFRLATRQDYAQSGIYVTFTSLGSGNIHGLEMTKKLEKSLITIDDLVQYPITYSLLSYDLQGNYGGSVGVGTTIFSLSGISSIKTGDLLKIEDEFVKVSNVGYGETSIGPISGIGATTLVQVERGVVGTSATSHTDLTEVKVYRGSYNIEGNKIYFTDPPKGDFRSSRDRSNLSYFKSKFNGRVYLRKDYTTNQLYDDISERFTGIGQTYVLTRDGINTVGLGSTGGNGILFINNLFQTPSTENNVGNNFKIIEDANVGVSSVVFSGSSADEGDADYTSEYDVNVNQLPRGGIIVSLGATGGLGYAPLVGASVTAVIDGSGTITSVGLGTTDIVGSGYYGTVSIGVTDPNHSGTDATITATVGVGGSLSFSVTDGGSGYVNPTIQVPSPSYDNLSVTGVSRLGVGSTTETGYGLLLNIDVSAASTTGIGSTLFEVSSFSIERNGYGFNVGDVITPVGLVTAKDVPAPVSQFELTVVDTFTDSFSLWQFGELDYIDSIKSLQNGVRTRFPLYYNSSLLSFETTESKTDSVEIDLSSVLLIFINGILQEPNVAYSFPGGSSVLFTKALRPEDEVSIFFYRGTRGEDSRIVSIKESIKSGDLIRIENNDLIPSTLTQEKRTVNNITSSDLLETNLYHKVGIDEVNEKPVTWYKQKIDRVINGEKIFKVRDSLESSVYPSAKIISDFGGSDSVIYVDDAQFFNYEENESSTVISSFDAIIVNGQDPVSAAITANVSSSGSIDLITISDGGSGYIGTSIDLKLSAPKQIGVGIGTTATATAFITSGIITSVSIVNPGLGYSVLTPPQVLAPIPNTTFENISGITNVEGFSGIITGISTTSGIGVDLALKFDLSVKTPTSFTGTGLTTGYPIYIFDTTIGGAVTSIDNSDSEVIGIGSTFFDNVYKIHSYTSIGSTTASIICNVSDSSILSGIDTFGYTQLGRFSWGRLSGFSRSSSPISIGVTGNTVNSGLTTFATIQRRGYGLRDTGALKKDLG
jgi:hypothetical protein